MVAAEALFAGTRPHARGVGAFVGADHVGVDRGGTEGCVAEPALDKVRRYVGLEGVHAEGVAKAARHCGCAGDPG
jgi:hypothetical protein